MAIFRVPRTRDYTIMSNHHLKDRTLSLKAKGLLSMILSLPDEWNFTSRGLAAICKEGVDSIGTALREMEKLGYLVRRQLRDEKGRITDTEYTVYERPMPVDGVQAETPETDMALAALPLPNPVQPDTTAPNTRQPDTGSPHTENPYMEASDTEKPSELIYRYNQELKQSNTNSENIHQSIPAASAPTQSQPAPPVRQIDEIDGAEKIYREIVLEDIEYDNLSERYGRDRVDEIVELIMETILSSKAYIRISGQDMLQTAVKSRFLKLTAEHVEYVFDCLDANTTEIRNIRAYLLAALFNAPVTMNSYYRARVNHDLYGSQNDSSDYGLPPDGGYRAVVAHGGLTDDYDVMAPPFPRPGNRSTNPQTAAHAGDDGAPPDDMSCRA